VFLEGQVAGHQADLGQRHVAQFIDDEKLIAGQLLLEPQQVLVVAGFDQLADQRSSSSEAHPMTALAGLQAEGKSDVSFSVPLPKSKRFSLRDSKSHLLVFTVDIVTNRLEEKGMSYARHSSPMRSTPACL
jgi:hypothetical protein